LSALLPSALLLFWSGIAATAVAGLVAAPLVGERLASIALASRNPGTGRALWLGLAAYPLSYGLGFTLMNEASLVTGALLGTAHAAIFGLLALRNGGSQLLRATRSRMLLCLVYGVVLGFAFVVP
jgi:hypothetical protein